MVIAVNTSFRLCPWANVLYAGNSNWWAAYADELADFRGLRLTKTQYYPALDLECMKQFPKFFTHPAIIGAGQHLGRVQIHNSGVTAVLIAAMFGARRIGLVGFDMRGSPEQPHWFGLHKAGLMNPVAADLARWRAEFDARAPALADAGLEIFNASPDSALTAYPKMGWREAVDRLLQ